MKKDPNGIPIPDLFLEKIRKCQNFIKKIVGEIAKF